MKNYLKSILLLGSLVVVDQLIKLFFEHSQPIVNLGFASLHYVTNTGASFGMLQGSNAALAWFSLIVLGLIMMNADKITKEHSAPMTLLVAGILGNLIDRAFRGYVIDFFDLGFWPVFNLADAMIFIGVIWLVIVILKKEHEIIHRKKNKKPALRPRAKNNR